MKVLEQEGCVNESDSFGNITLVTKHRMDMDGKRQRKIAISINKLLHYRVD